MGFNTIAFIRNDSMDELTNAPQSTASILTSYVNSLNHKSFDLVYDTCKHFKEPYIDPQTLTVFPSRHASSTTIYIMSGNGCREVREPKVITKNGKKYFLVPVNSNGLTAK